MRIACVQMDVTYGDPAANADRIVAHLRRLADDGVELAVFPEAALTGYAADTREEGERIAIYVASPEVEAVQDVVDATGVHAVVGLIELSGSHLYNTAILFAPNDVRRCYRKTHLPELGVDHFVYPGDELRTFDTKFGELGILICFDLKFPEATRALALEGADLIVLPTNWPEGAEVSADAIAISRAAENRVFVATCNRVGEENGFRFIGRSKIVAPNGTVLASAGADEAVLIVDVDLAEARQKRTTVIPGRYETEAFATRRPELYGRVAAPNRSGEPA